MATLTEEQEDDVNRAMLAVINAWESNAPLTEDDMCFHLEEILKVMEDKNNFDTFLKATDFNTKEQLWIN